MEKAEVEGAVLQQAGLRNACCLSSLAEPLSFRFRETLSQSKVEGAGERVLWLRELVAVIEDPAWFPALTWWFTTQSSLTLVPGG